MLLRSCAQLLLCLVPCSVLAQSGGIAEPKLATKEQYLACLSGGDSVDARQVALAKRREDLKAYALKFQAADTSLAEQVKRHTPSNKAEVASYNRAVQTRNQAAQEFNERSRSIERDQEILNMAVFDLNAKCGGILVSSEVKEAADFERRHIPAVSK